MTNLQRPNKKIALSKRDYIAGELFPWIFVQKGMTAEKAAELTAEYALELELALAAKQKPEEQAGDILTQRDYFAIQAFPWIYDDDASTDLSIEEIADLAVKSAIELELALAKQDLPKPGEDLSEEEPREERHLDKSFCTECVKEVLTQYRKAAIATEERGQAKQEIDKVQLLLTKHLADVLNGNNDESLSDDQIFILDGFVGKLTQTDPELGEFCEGIRAMYKYTAVEDEDREERLQELERQSDLKQAIAWAKSLNVAGLNKKTKENLVQYLTSLDHI